MDIREYKDYKEDEIHRLYAEVGWTAYTENMPALEQGYKNSLLVLAAYEKEELLGIIRVVGDGLLFGSKTSWYFQQGSVRVLELPC